MMGEGRPDVKTSGKGRWATTVVGTVLVAIVVWFVVATVVAAATGRFEISSRVSDTPPEPRMASISVASYIEQMCGFGQQPYRLYKDAPTAAPARPVIRVLRTNRYGDERLVAFEIVAGCGTWVIEVPYERVTWTTVPAGAEPQAIFTFSDVTVGVPISSVALGIPDTPAWQQLKIAD
jgi:hypothetical protein